MQPTSLDLVSSLCNFLSLCDTFCHFFTPFHTVWHLFKTLCGSWHFFDTIYIDTFWQLLGHLFENFFKKISQTRWTFFRVKLVFKCEFEISWSLGPWDFGTPGPWNPLTLSCTGSITERDRPHFGLFEASMMFPIPQLMFQLILLSLGILKWGKTFP